MTIFYPDISGYQAGIDLRGAVAVCCKATEGTTYVNPDYGRAKGNAAGHGTYFFAYHFLHQGNAAAQARHCFSVTGGLSVMIDAETTGSSNPTVTDIAAFCDTYRALGGICNTVYLPHWFWQRIGSPSLASLVSRGLRLVSSAYPSSGYSDNGPGWAGYGGMPVSVWQYTASQPFNGRSVDFNAFKGTLAQFQALTGGPSVAPQPESLILRQGDAGPAVGYLQKRLNVWGAQLSIDSAFGPVTLTAVKQFQGMHGLTIDGVVGPATWSELDKVPVTPGGDWTFARLRAFEVVGEVMTSVAVRLLSPPGYVGTPPSNLPGVDHYDILVRVGGKDTARHQVDKGTPEQVFQIDGVPSGTDVTILGRACLADGSHSSPWSSTTARTVG